MLGILLFAALIYITILTWPAVPVLLILMLLIKK